MAILAGNNFNVKDFAPALWLDAADSNTLYDAVSGGALVGAGGAVARWEDKSGNGRHATQATLANRPLRTVGAQNTRDALTFDGVNDFLNTAAFGGTQDCTFFIVAASKNSSQYRVLAAHAASFESPNPGGNYIAVNASRLETTTNGGALSTKHSLKLSTAANMPNNVFGLISVEYTNTNAGHIPRLNGSTYSISNTPANDPGVFTRTATSFGVGAYNGGGLPCHCDIAEVIYFTRLLTATERQSVERYLANKWGLGFNPLSLSPALWLDASDSNTLYDATTGGALVGAGGAVARWEDKSGNARHATQATLANRPLRTAAAQGGKDALTFDGVNDFMATPAFGGTQDCTYFLVAASKNATQIKVFAAHANNYENPPLGANYVAVNTARLETSQNGASGTTKLTSKLAASQNLQNNIFRIIGVQFTSTNAGHIQRVNGAAHATTNAYPQDPGVFTKAAQSFGVGAYNGGIYQCHCDIAELIYFTKLLTASERQAVERYLAQKWNIIT